MSPRLFFRCFAEWRRDAAPLKPFPELVAIIGTRRLSRFAGRNLHQRIIEICQIGNHAHCRPMAHTHRFHRIERPAIRVRADTQQSVQRAASAERMNHIQRMKASPSPLRHVACSRFSCERVHRIVCAGDQKHIVIDHTFGKPLRRPLASKCFQGTLCRATTPRYKGFAVPKARTLKFRRPDTAQAGCETARAASTRQTSSRSNQPSPSRPNQSIRQSASACADLSEALRARPSRAGRPGTDSAGSRYRSELHSYLQASNRFDQTAVGRFALYEMVQPAGRSQNIYTPVQRCAHWLSR